MPKCPHCNGKLEIIPPVERNAEQYGGHPKGTTKCCGNIVAVFAKVTFEYSIPYNHEELTQDDWGNPKGTKK